MIDDIKKSLYIMESRKDTNGDVADEMSMLIDNFEESIRLLKVNRKFKNEFWRAITQLNDLVHRIKL